MSPSRLFGQSQKTFRARSSTEIDTETDMDHKRIFTHATSYLLAGCKVRAGPVTPAVATTDCSQHTVKLEGNSTVTQLTRVVLKLQSDSTQVTHPQLYGGFLNVT